MRVIAGKAKGMRLKGRRSKFLRPTPDMVREGLFSILGERLGGASFLDLYAGTGAVGIEALSRGARGAVFVERQPGLARVIRENLAVTRLGERGRVLCAEAGRAVAEMTSEGQKFDFVFADPPYYTDAEEALDKVQRILAAGGILICQHSKREGTPSPAGLERVAQRRFGDTVLTFFISSSAR